MPLLLRTIIKSAGSPPSSALKALLNYGIPTGVGVGTAGYAAGSGQPIDMSLGYGVGAAMASSPKGWKNIHNLAKQSPDYINEFGRGTLKALMAKAAPVAGVAGLHYGPDILHNIDSASKAVSNTASNTADITNAAKEVAPNIAKNLNDTVSNAKKTFDIDTGPLHDVMTSVSGAGKSVSELAAQAGNLNDSVSQVGDAANRIGDAAYKATDFIGNIGQHTATKLEKIKEFAGNNKLLLSSLLAGGALGTGAYMTRKKKPQVINNYYK